jgi:hypothetical protein
MREFIVFCREHWQLTEKDAADLNAASNPDYRNGYNAAMTDGVDGAFACWAEENGI